MFRVHLGVLGVIALLSQRSGQIQCRQSPWMLVVGFQKRVKGTRRAPGRKKRDEKERGRECVEARPQKPSFEVHMVD
jgi:hypothetical protein